MMDLRALIDAVPASLTIEGKGVRASITIPLAISDDERVQVALDVRLWRGHWHGQDVHECKFAIIVLDTETAVVAEIFDRHEAAPYVAPVRALVMPCVCAAVRALVRAISPAIIYRATYLSDPPRNSLSKHQMITDTIIDCGYAVLMDAIDSSGRRFWLMEQQGVD